MNVSAIRPLHRAPLASYKSYQIIISYRLGHRPVGADLEFKKGAA